MSNTPETDAKERNMSGAGVTVHTKYVAADFARELELERDRLRVINAELLESLRDVFRDSGIYDTAVAKSGKVFSEEFMAWAAKARSVIGKATREAA